MQRPEAVFFDGGLLPGGVADEDVEAGVGAEEYLGEEVWHVAGLKLGYVFSDLGAVGLLSNSVDVEAYQAVDDARAH